MKKSWPTKLLFLAPVILLFLVLGKLNLGHSASLTNVSATISNSRPSFRGALAAGNTVGTSIITINTTVDAQPSTDSAQLVEGDVLGIGEAGSIGTYTVASTATNAIVNLTGALAAGDADAGDIVISTVSANLTVRFNTVSAVNNGKIRILVPAHSDNNLAADGIPDGGNFDFGTGAGATITCPAGVTGYTFGAAVTAASSISINGQDYHSFVCPYTGTGTVGANFGVTGSAYFVINNLINPAPATGHVAGTADTYPVIVQQLDGSDTVIDTTTVRIGVVEAVKVTATVDPQITFRIFGTPAGTAACGFTGGSDITTTATTVPFGGLYLDAFKDGVQGMVVSTNAVSGYAVTAAMNDQLGRNGGTCAGANPTSNTCINDPNIGGMTPSVNANWSAITTKGFAYSLHDINNTVTEAFAYNSSGHTFSARHFADLEAAETPVQIFSDSTVADTDNIYVCYRIIPDVVTAAGNYENYIIYTATATF